MNVQELSNTDLYYLLKMLDLQRDNCRTNMLANSSYGEVKGSTMYDKEWQKLNQKMLIIKTEINKRIEDIK